MYIVEKNIPLMKYLRKNYTQYIIYQKCLKKKKMFLLVLFFTLEKSNLNCPETNKSRPSAVKQLNLPLDFQVHVSLDFVNSVVECLHEIVYRQLLRVGILSQLLQ